ncbi:protein phosphatase CheZ [Desulfovibrio inopinatus]|uniref:protein phosphatase CheZ n=1 Tax=Desulfovibrio inopinatus TaxID=102109 RepID=UPI0004260B79|nr:protein phosphatase CheZ [Desulfovibrio inopinatus]
MSVDPTNNADLEFLIEKVSDSLGLVIKQSLREGLREEALLITSTNIEENHFFKRLNEGIMEKLSTIYREVSNIQGMALGVGEGDMENVEQAGSMIKDVTDRLDEIIQATEKATFRIMDIVESNLQVLENITTTLKSIEDENLRAALLQSCNVLNNDMIEILTTLSFQDLTGQRIKRVISSVGKVREMIQDLYMSTGMIIKAKEMAPDEHLEKLQEEVSRKVSQNDVDEILAQLNSA